MGAQQADGLSVAAFNPSRIWDEALLVIGFVALIMYIGEGHTAPDPLPVAVLAALLLLGRIKDRQ